MLNPLLFRPRWVVPVLPKGELEVLLETAIELGKKGKWRCSFTWLSLFVVARFEFVVVLGVCDTPSLWCYLITSQGSMSRVRLARGSFVMV